MVDSLLPLEGSPGDLSARLWSYIERYDRTMVSSWRGADEALVHRYATLAGFKDASALPPAYRSFLTAMGNDDGGLLRNLKLISRLEKLVEFYLESDANNVDAELPVCAYYVIGEQVSFDRRTDGDEPQLVETTDGEVDDESEAVVARNWEALIMQAAMLHVEARRLQHRRWCSVSASELARAQPQGCDAQKLGELISGLAALDHGVLAWPSDSRHVILVSENASVWARSSDTGGALFYGFANEQCLADRLLASLALVFGASTVGAAILASDGSLGTAP